MTRFILVTFRPMVARGINPPPNGPFPCHQSHLPEILCRWSAVLSIMSYHSLDGSNNTQSWRSLYRSAASCQSPCAPPPRWPAPAQIPGHTGCLDSQWQSQMVVGDGGAATADPCAGGQHNGGLFGKCKWHPRRKQKDKNVRMKNPRIGFRRIYGRHFSIAHILSSGRRQSQRVAVSNITSCLVRGKQTKAFILLRFYL